VQSPGIDGVYAIVLVPGARPDGMRVFSATRRSEIECVGERATAWLAIQADLQITELWIAQSSCRAVPCYSLCLWYRRRA